MFFCFNGSILKYIIIIIIIEKRPLYIFVVLL